MSLSTSSTRPLNTSRDGDSTTALGSLVQCLITLSVKKNFLISSLNLPWRNLRPFPLVLMEILYGNLLTFPLCLSVPRVQQSPGTKNSENEEGKGNIDEPGTSSRDISHGPWAALTFYTDAGALSKQKSIIATLRSRRDATAASYKTNVNT
ncbi:hypothetical protein QYF61_010565, partial [Mycteria americana]